MTLDEDTIAPAQPPPDPRLIAAVLVRQQGRVRISPRELAEVTKGQLALKRLDDGTLVLEFREGET